ncbi:MAG: hypothetical protein ACXVZQ_04995 [Terriglobales bacterium]
MAPHAPAPASSTAFTLHLVMGPAAPGTSVRFRVLLTDTHGRRARVDVDDQGNGTVTEPRMYQSIRQPKPIVDRQFEIEYLDAGVEVFSSFSDSAYN